jgi:hypothetical protein
MYYDEDRVPFDEPDEETKTKTKTSSTEREDNEAAV